MKLPRYKVFAAIELGSTEITMKIAEISKKNGISVLDTVKYDISLGKESYTVGKISYGLVDKICSCFEKYLIIMKEYGVEESVCYATTAVREASNSEYIIDQINIRTGIKVSIISNEEERFLHNKAFALKNSYFDDIIQAGAVMVDVSSGSMQVSYYKESELKFTQSVPVGPLRVLEGLQNSNSIDILEKFISATINNYKNVFFKNVSYKYFVAMGNQIKYIKRICGIDGDNIKISDFDKVYLLADERGEEYISDKYEIPYETAQLTAPSILFYKMFLKNEKNKIIIAPEISLVDGILVEYAEKNAYTHTKHIFTDDIISSAKFYAEKYGVDSLHYNKVSEIGENIITTLSKKFGFSKRQLVLLKVASIFADTGYYININEYNRYSYDIIKANPIIGLSQKEHEIVCCIVLFQNGIFDFEEYNYYSKNRKLLISKLAAILSLSKALDTEHDQKIKKTESAIKNGSLVITAYTDEDISLEKHEFNKAQEFFEEVFGIKAVLLKKGMK